jgi:spore maturation protein CgeB
MKVLVLNESDDYALGASYARAFRFLGHDVALWDPVAKLEKLSLWRFAPTRRILESQLICRSNRKWLEDLLAMPADFIWVGKGAWAAPWLWQEIKRRKPQVKLVCYNADNPIVSYSRGGNRPWVTESIACFDIYCTYNRSLVKPLQAAGAKKVLWIPFAWDHWAHPELEISDEARRAYASDILFVGNADSYRERWIGDIIEAAKPYDWTFRIYGNWKGIRNRRVLNFVQGIKLHGKEMVKAVGAAKISMNILRLQNENSHNMRTFEIPGCNGVMISQFSPEQNEFFEDGEAAVYFRTPQEAVDKLALVLSRDSLLGKLRKSAHEVASQNTYVHRARTLLEYI